MSITVCLSANTIGYPEGGGHRWVYLNWALGLRALGCQVVWLEGVGPRTPPCEVQARVATLKRCLEDHGLAAAVALSSATDEPLSQDALKGTMDVQAAVEADLLLNLRYRMRPALVECFRRSALVDIDPGLLQVWMGEGQLRVARHDVYFTTGETVGTPAARFPDCGLRWHYTPPPVFLPAWPPAAVDSLAPYTTVSTWYGGEWVAFGAESFDNDKRVSFLEYRDLPSYTPTPLELALCLGPDDEDERRLLEQKGWSIRHAWEVCSTPEQYRAYVQQSRGEFSCAKPSCMRLENAWISDRTLCYLASGKPAVVQHTGASRFLPDAEGLFRFRSVHEAAQALTAAESDYERHCRLARALAEEYFDAQKVVRSVLERALA